MRRAIREPPLLPCTAAFAFRDTIHGGRSFVRSAVYNRASYMAEMRAAIDLWERYLQEKILCCTA